MKQTMTGPYGYVAYFNPMGTAVAQYPALNLPKRDFAKPGAQHAANDPMPPHVVPLPRRRQRTAAVAMLSVADRHNF